MKPMLQSIFDSVGNVHLVNPATIARITTPGGITGTGSFLVDIELTSGSIIVVDSGCAPRADEADSVGAIDRALHEVASWFELVVVE